MQENDYEEKKMKNKLVFMTKRKLNTTSGASLALGLLFFLMCGMVGSVVLTAGSVAAGRVRSEREASQMQHTLQSAVRLLCKQMEDCQYIGDNIDTNSSMNLASAGADDSISKAVSDQLKTEIDNAFSRKTFSDALVSMMLSMFKTQWEQIFINSGFIPDPGIMSDNTDIDLTVLSDKSTSSIKSIAAGFLLESKTGSESIFDNVSVSVILDPEYHFSILVTPDKSKNYSGDIDKMYMRIDVPAVANCQFPGDNINTLTSEKVNAAGDNGVILHFYLGSPTVSTTSFK